MTVLEYEFLPAPHRPPSRLRAGSTAVYVFSLSPDYGTTCAAGPNRVLKVGKVGMNSAPRFCYQHYSPGWARSNLAGSLLTGTQFPHLRRKVPRPLNGRSVVLVPGGRP
jgi:hypothetical protein